MYIDQNTIITTASVLSALVVIFFGCFCSIPMVPEAEPAGQGNRKNEKRAVPAYIRSPCLPEGPERAGVQRAGYRSNRQN